MAFKLPSTVHSPELLESVAYELETYLEWYRQARTQHRVGVKPLPEPTYSAETSEVIKAWFSDKKPTVEAIGELLKYLHELKMPVVHVMLAALPNHAQRLQLVDWFRQTAGIPVLVSFVADRNLGGGVVVRTPNRMFDYSWRQRLVEGRAKVGEIINRER